MTTSTSEQRPVFDYRALRALVGIVAFVLPPVVWLISFTSLPSVSASYHTAARDFFVGALFGIAALLLGYNGHTSQEYWASKGAAVAAAFAAIFPTSCRGCPPDPKSGIHYVAGALLFGIIAWFCLVPFRKKTKGKGGKKERRARVYLACGLVIIGCMLVAGAAGIMLSDAAKQESTITFWMEFVALWAFGVAWFVAGKVIRPLVDEDERLKLSLKRSARAG